jgi:hypothetical protein
LTVTGEPVGDDERGQVERPRGRDPGPQMAEAPQVLHGGLRPRIDEADHVITGW